MKKDDKTREVKAAFVKAIKAARRAAKAASASALIITVRGDEIAVDIDVAMPAEVRDRG